MVIFTGTGSTKAASFSERSGQLVGTLIKGGLLPLLGPSPASAMLLKKAKSF